MGTCCQSEAPRNRQTLSSISVVTDPQQRRSPTNSLSDKDKTEKYPTQLLSDYILNISEEDQDSISKHYATINSTLSASSWFSHNIVTKQSFEVLQVSINDIAFESGSFFIEQLKNLNVDQSNASIIKKSIQDQVDVLKESKDIHAFENLSNTFYCHLSQEQAETSYIGMIIYGFASTKSSKKMKLICCGHTEEWRASNFRALSLQNKQAKEIKNYVIHQLLERVGAANYATKPSLSLQIQAPPNPVSVELNLKQFHMNMSRREVVKIMALDKYPVYQIDNDGYLQSSKGLFIGKQYVLLEDVGKGAFSKVYQAVDIKNQSKCALKVIRGVQPFMSAACNELEILNEIKAAQNEICIDLQKHFEWKNHHCFVFKLYGPSILEVMSKNNFLPFPEEMVRSITYQICNAMDFLHSLGIVFTDLKPENILFVEDRLCSVRIDNTRQVYLPYNSRIKVIDFGSAVYEMSKKKGKRFNNHLIQTRHYRAPEVLLGMAWNQAVDVWSVGCVVLELLNGYMVFVTHCSIDHLHQIQNMIGPMPSIMVRSASRNKFNELFHSADGSLKMEDAKRSKYEAKALNEYFNMNKLEQAKLFNLMSRCLRWKAAERIRSEEFFKHEYFQLIEDVLSYDHQPNLIKFSQMYTRYHK